MRSANYADRNHQSDNVPRMQVALATARALAAIETSGSPLGRWFVKRNCQTGHLSTQVCISVGARFHWAKSLQTRRVVAYS